VLRGRLRDLARKRRRIGYRRLIVLLGREGEPSGITRLHSKEGLVVRKRQARRKFIGTRAPMRRRNAVRASPLRRLCKE
jgi:hypothetical protein